MDRLEHLALRHCERVEGPTGEHFQRAMLRAKRFGADDYRCDAEDLEPAVAALLGRLHPEKVANAPDDGLAEFVRLATDHIDRNGLSAEHGALVLPALMLMLGTHAATDPLYPWIAEALAGGTDTEPGAKERALLDAGNAYLERALALIRGTGSA
jgi:hypothetical protein